VCPPEICHGDLHMANVLSRTRAPQLVKSGEVVYGV
jgi:Ser/Thr protein kinase RdoA (MazF antagonist)